MGEGNKPAGVHKGRLVSCGPEPAPGRRPDAVHLVPLHVWRGEYDALGQAVSPAYENLGIGDVQQLELHLVSWPGIARVDDPYAVGHHQSTLEWRATSGEDGKAVSGRDFDDKACADEGDRPGRNC